MQTQRPRYIAVEAGDADTHVAGVALKLQKDGQRAERKAHKDDTTGGGKEIDAGFHQKFLCGCNLPPSGGKAFLDTPGNPEKIFSVTSPFRERQAARQHGHVGLPDAVPDGDGGGGGEQRSSGRGVRRRKCRAAHDGGRRRRDRCGCYLSAGESPCERCFCEKTV